MADNTVTGAVTSSIRPQARPTAVSGIGAKTPAKQEEKAEMSFMDRITNLFTSFGGKDPKEKPASVNTYNAKISVYQDMEDEARTSAELARQDRQGLGITRSLTGQEWTQTFGKEKALEPNVTAPFWHQGQEHPEVLTPAPVEAAAIPAQTTGEGLMARSTSRNTDAGVIYRALSRKEQEAEGIVTPFSGTGTFTLLKGVEGFKEKPYSLNAKETIGGSPHKSGLTVGAGLDFGQHSKASLEAMGVPSNIIDRVEEAGWLGLNPDTIIDPVTGVTAATRKRGHELMWQRYTDQKNNNTLPSFSRAELDSITEGVFRSYEDSAKTQYENKKGSGTWDALPQASRDIMSLEIYHRGTNYNLPDSMLDAAEEGTPEQVARSIRLNSRRDNVLYWLNRLPTKLAPITSSRPQARPTQE